MRTRTENPLPSVLFRVPRGLIPIFSPVLPDPPSHASPIPLNSLRQPLLQGASPFFKARVPLLTSHPWREGGEKPRRGEAVTSPCVLAGLRKSVLLPGAPHSSVLAQARAPVMQTRTTQSHSYMPTSGKEHVRSHMQQSQLDELIHLFI